MPQFVNLQIILLCCTDLCQERIKEEAGECSEETPVCVSRMVFFLHVETKAQTEMNENSLACLP